MTEKELEQLLLEDCDKCTKVGGRGYIGKQMINTYGSIEATKRLVNDKKNQSGFVFLMERNMAELTMEYKVLKYPHFFDKQTIENADFKINNWKEWQKLPNK